MATLAARSLEFQDVANAVREETEITSSAVQRASHFAVVQFFEAGGEEAEARNFVADLGESNFAFAGIHLLIATRRTGNSFSRKHIERTHACTSAVAQAVANLQPDTAEVIPVYKKRMLIDGWLPYGTAGREKPEDLGRYSISPKAVAASNAASIAYSKLLDPLLDGSPGDAAASINTARGIEYKNIGLIVLTSSHDSAQLAANAARMDHITAQTIGNATVFINHAQLQAVA